MFPFVYEFHWSFGHILFLSIFFSVITLVAVTVVRALFRMEHAVKADKINAIRWHTEFEDLPTTLKTCRHQLNGEIVSRTCNHEFDCRTCVKHQEFLAVERPSMSSAIATVAGLSIPMDRMYHRGHTWVKQESDGTFIVGLDEFAKRMLGQMDRVLLPAVGTKLSVNAPGWEIDRHGERVRILSPIEGEVAEVGSTGTEWFLKVKGSDTEQATRHLLRGKEVTGWMSNELDRLQTQLSRMGQLGVTLADGGELMEDLPKQLPNVSWNRVWSSFFLEA